MNRQEKTFVVTAILLTLGYALIWPALFPRKDDLLDTVYHAELMTQIIIMIVSMIITAALTPKPPQPKPASLEDFDAPTAEEGKSIPVVFGTAWLKSPNVIWYGDLSSRPIKSKSGKK